ncbi:uncharacterized protein BDZ99DRAFT_565876 [Mytilinidion resinicola]|uniref:GED domain-containing protein n=1 Tax=Mytilinidion resinicola TaxID=574789 RepID=A0A6A6Z4C1_9PEZI|nr:uncharacterized protein BDZ99DRAFT_565876 [Mytilinidion resinicola]KAF2815992.1 hypothetical protein BDZ99DRAFT_565876 [Mytilinidion resinicola]
MENIHLTPFHPGHLCNHGKMNTVTNSATRSDIPFEYELESLLDSQMIDGALTLHQQTTDLCHDSGPGISVCHDETNAIDFLQNLSYFPQYSKFRHLGETQAYNELLAPTAISMGHAQHQPNGRASDVSIYTAPRTIFANDIVELPAKDTGPIPAESCSLPAHNQKKKECKTGKNGVKGRVRVERTFVCGKTKGANAVRKYRHDSREWKQMFDQHINRLKQGGQTSEEIAVVLTIIHGFTTSMSRVSKGPPKRQTDAQKAPSNRAAQALPKKTITIADAISDFLMKPREREKAPNRVLELSFKEYIHQERAFHALHSFINGSFDLKSGRWTVSAFKRLDASSHRHGSWWLREARCRSMTMFALNSLYDRVSASFRELLDLQGVAEPCDPSMLIYFWPICQTLFEVRLLRQNRKKFVLLRAFWVNLRKEFARAAGGHPFVQFLDSLMMVLNTSPEHIRPTVGLAYWKTIHMLDSFLRPESADHPVILRMGSHCSNNWKTRFQPQIEQLERRYQTDLQSLEASNCLGVKRRISVLQDYVEAISKSESHNDTLITLATQLWDLSAKACNEGAKMQKLQWTHVTEALASSADRLAIHYFEGGRKHNEHDLSCGLWYMNEAIEILRFGDLLCQHQALCLSGRLKNLFKGKTRGVAAAGERFRWSAILDVIPRIKLVAQDPRGVITEPRSPASGCSPEQHLIPLKSSYDILTLSPGSPPDSLTPRYPPYDVQPSDDTPPPIEMHKTIDLVDHRQIELFEALERLKSLQAASDIKTPQLIVVGDQSSGKSSILEALARFHFPVHEELCTRFPTKLILKRSDRKLLKVHFDLKLDSRTDEENAKLQSFVQHVEASSRSYWDDLGDLMVKAADALGSTKTFTEDVLVIEKHGPELPILSLVDLPGLFRANSAQQSRVDRDTVERIFKEHIKEPANLVLVVVTASITAVNQTVVEEVQKLARKDYKLLNRLIAVVTHPDLDEDRLAETKRVLTEEPPLLGNMELLHKCHVVRNQTKAERITGESLDNRDRKEALFFNGDNWRHVSNEQKGIHSLRATLKDLFWTRTKDELRKTIIPKIKGKIVDIDACVKAADASRSNDHQRRDYLCDVAEEFERLIREGVKGEYDDKGCRELHLIGEREKCRQCRGFFPDPRLGLNTDDGQQYKLCSNVRALNKVFAATMRRFGRTNIIDRQEGSEPGATNVETNSQHDLKSPGRARKDKINEYFLSAEVLSQYYTSEEPKSIPWKDYEDIVNQAMARNKGREPDGEPNWIVYRDLFRYQSAGWAKIAEKHVRAVCEETEKYLALALTRACQDESVRQAIQDKIIRPNFKILQREANRTLTHLLECHRTGNPGFLDSFGDIFTVQEQAKDLDQTLDLFGWGHLEQRLGKDLIKNIKHGLGVLILSSISPVSAKGYLGTFVFKHAYDILSKQFSLSNDTDQKDAATDKVTKPILDYDHDYNAAGVIAGVESYYKTAMIAFVGYVNALVIEADILRELEGRIFSQRLMRHESQTLINEIAAEDEDEAEKRKKNKGELESLKSILKTLEEGLADKK